MIDLKSLKAPVIAFLSGKGGSGKSTFSINTAIALADFGLNVGAIDTDFEQHSMFEVFNYRKKNKIEGAGKVTPYHLLPHDIEYQILELSTLHDVIIIDGAAKHDFEANRCILNNSSYFVVPVKTGAIEEGSLAKFIHNVLKPCIQHRKVSGGLLLNCYKERTGSAKQTKEIIENRYSWLPTYDVAMGFYEPMIQSLTVGLGILTYSPKHPAAHIFQKFLDELTEGAGIYVKTQNRQANQSTKRRSNSTTAIETTNIQH
jgi:cellulose biosynthesis protein BcsQ